MQTHFLNGTQKKTNLLSLAQTQKADAETLQLQQDVVHS